MSLIRMNREPSRRQLAVFSVTWLIFFAVIGFFAHSVLSLGFWLVGVAVPAIGWFRPGFLRAVYLGMVYATFPIGVVLSYLMLIAIYYLVLTPVGWATRLFGHDPMNRGFDPQARSYWVARQPPATIDRYFRQF